MQVQCGFYKQGFCQTCESCKARPYEINESCQSCLSCESRPNYLRFGDDELQEELKQAERQQEPDGVILIYKDRPLKRREEEEVIR